MAIRILKNFILQKKSNFWSSVSKSKRTFDIYRKWVGPSWVKGSYLKISVMVQDLSSLTSVYPDTSPCSDRAALSCIEIWCSEIWWYTGRRGLVGLAFLVMVYFINQHSHSLPAHRTWQLLFIGNWSQLVLFFFDADHSDTNK